MDINIKKINRGLLLHSMCRLCLKETAPINVISIFENTSSIELQIEKCFSLKVSKDDGLPPNMCNLCASKLKDFFEFKQTVQRSDESLRQLLTNKEASVDDDDACSYSSDASCGLVIKTEDLSGSEEGEDDDNIPLSQIATSKRNSTVNLKTSGIKTEKIRGRTPKNKPYCRICNLKFLRFPEYIEHHQDAHGGSPAIGEKLPDSVDNEKFVIYRCHVCKQEFDSRGGLRLHCVTQHDVKVIHPYGCSHCDRQFPSWSLLVVHERQHTGIKPYSCDICGKEQFISIASLRRHKLMHLKVYSCEECGRDFNCDSALKAHIICKHTDEKPFLCNICGRSFSLATILNAHMTSHSTERKYRCEICGFCSKTSGNHHRHRARHNQGGAKTFHCETCGKAFETKLKLSSHQIIHTSVRPHICKLCGKGFLYNNKLERHILLVHAKERPYPCHICGRKLASKFGLGIHLKTHTKEENDDRGAIEYKQVHNIIVMPNHSSNIQNTRMLIH